MKDETNTGGYWELPYASARMPVLGRNVVATSQPLAAQAGLRMLLQGGNAVDAALAAAIALTVVEPNSTGIGGDALAMVWDGQQVHALNGSGKSPAGWTAQKFAGETAMPDFGWDTVTVPGCVSAWAALSSRFGKLPFKALFAPAIDYATHGYPVSPTIAKLWSYLIPVYKDYPDIASTFAPGGRAPVAGEIMKFAQHAQTLAEIAETGGESFYRGRLAQCIADYAKQGGGALSMHDLAAHEPQWVKPVSNGYRGATVHEMPPSSQGLATLMALGILENFDLKRLGADSVDAVHLQIEAMKLAFADTYRYVGDPGAMTLAAARLLDPGYLQERSRSIDLQKAQFPQYGTPKNSGTVYISAADASGMMVSLMQSNNRGFGSGLVVPGTGIALHSRGRSFGVVPGMPNCVGPGKRPFHSLMPAFVTRGSEPLLSFGVMGFNMQPQAHVQMLVRLLDFGQNPQTISDAPRWRIAYEEPSVLFEPAYDRGIIAQLEARGHSVIARETRFKAGSTYIGNTVLFGAAQLVLKQGDAYVAASDHRRDGQAVAF